MSPEQDFAELKQVLREFHDKTGRPEAAPSRIEAALALASETINDDMVPRIKKLTRQCDALKAALEEIVSVGNGDVSYDIARQALKQLEEK